jgi:hypothetical protein
MGKHDGKVAQRTSCLTVGQMPDIGRQTRSLMLEASRRILLGIAGTVTGAVAMLSPKRAGRHPRYGSIYYWCLAGIFLTATGLAVARWAEDYHLFVLGAMSFGAACFGRHRLGLQWCATSHPRLASSLS